MIRTFWLKLGLLSRLLLLVTLALVAILIGVGLTPLPNELGLLVIAAPPFPVRPDLLAVAVGYRNESAIADSVLPRVPVGTKKFRYLSYPKGEMFTVPETLVGRKGIPNEVDFSATEATDECQDHALDDYVPLDDIDQARTQEGLPDPEKRATVGINELISVKREKRVADLVFAQATYAAANRTILAGGTQWSDFVNSNPIDAILAAFDALLMRPTIGVFGQATWTKLRQHPKICKAVFGNNTDAGIVTRRQVAELFELRDVVVGAGWLNTAKKGQPVNMVRVWGKHAAFLHQNPNADTERGVTYGVTAQWGTKFAGSEFDRKRGMRGSMNVRSGESVKELVLANDLGYFFENAVA